MTGLALILLLLVTALTLLGARLRRSEIERAGIDRIRIDVDGDVAIILLDDFPQLAHRRLVLGNAASKGEFIGHAT